MKKLNQKGFTLIEMMIVLIVVSVLTLLVIPNASDYITKANTEGCAAYKSSLTAQANAHRLTNGSYPENLDSIIEGATDNLNKICVSEKFNYDNTTGQVK